MQRTGLRFEINFGTQTLWQMAEQTTSHIIVFPPIFYHYLSNARDKILSICFFLFYRVMTMPVIAKILRNPFLGRNTRDGWRYTRQTKHNSSQTNLTWFSTIWFSMETIWSKTWMEKVMVILSCLQKPSTSTTLIRLPMTMKIQILTRLPWVSLEIRYVTSHHRFHQRQQQHTCGLELFPTWLTAYVFFFVPGG